MMQKKGVLLYLAWVMATGLIAGDIARHGFVLAAAGIGILLLLLGLPLLGERLVEG